MTKIAGSGSAYGSGYESRSGSISQRHGSADPDPDPPQNVMHPQHWLIHYSEGQGREKERKYKEGRGLKKSHNCSIFL
jgi:hypothetical protein